MLLFLLPRSIEGHRAPSMTYTSLVHAARTKVASARPVLERHSLPADLAPGQRPVAVVVHCRVVGEDGPHELWLKMAPAAPADCVAAARDPT